MNAQSVIVALVVGLVVLVPLWTIAAVRRRYGAEASKFPWWWLWSRIGCNGIMGAGVALSVFGVWAWTQDIEDPSWWPVLQLALIAAFLAVGVARLLLGNKVTETYYPESFPLACLWLVAIIMAMIMYLVNGLSAHVLNGLLLTGSGAAFTRLLKRWI